MTHLSRHPAPAGHQPPLLMHSITPCVSVSVCVSQADKVADCQTGHLLACFQSQQPFGGYTMYWQGGINEGARLLICVSVLSERVEGVTSSSPCFPSLSAHLVVAMGTARQRQTLQQAPEGIVRTARRFKGKHCLSFHCFASLPSLRHILK